MTGITVCFLRWRGWSNSTKWGLGHPARMSGKGEMKTQRYTSLERQQVKASQRTGSQREAVRSHQLERQAQMLGKVAIKHRAPELKAIGYQETSPWELKEVCQTTQSSLHGVSHKQQVMPDGLLKAPHGTQQQIWGCHPYNYNINKHLQ